MLLFIALIAIGFSYVGQTLQQTAEVSPQLRLLIWALGASLFVDTISFISVSYFDQSAMFIYLILAIIGSARSGMIKAVFNRSKIADGSALTRSERGV